MGGRNGAQGREPGCGGRKIDGVDLTPAVEPRVRPSVGPPRRWSSTAAGQISKLNLERIYCLQISGEASSLLCSAGAASGPRRGRAGRRSSPSTPPLPPPPAAAYRIGSSSTVRRTGSPDRPPLSAGLPDRAAPARIRRVLLDRSRPTGSRLYCPVGGTSGAAGPARPAARPPSRPAARSVRRVSVPTEAGGGNFPFRSSKTQFGAQIYYTLPLTL